MVMSRKAMRKNLTQSIIKSLGRYIAIVAIIALGAGIFVGLRTTKVDMIATGQQYLDRQNMFDLRLLNTYGWTQKEVDAIADLDLVEEAEGAVWVDAIVRGEAGGDSQVYRFHSIPERISQVYLLGGRMPSAPDECLVDGHMATDAVLGQQITLDRSNDEDTLESFAYRTYTVVGYISTPLYMDLERGSTSVGNGTLTSYIYIPEDGFTVDFFTEIQITIPGEYEIYSEQYNDALDHAADELEVLVEPLAQDRFTQLKADAQEEYDKGLAEYQDGLKEYRDGKAEAEKELADAKQELENAQEEIDANRTLIEDGMVQMKDTQELLAQNAVTLAESKKTLAEAKAEAYAQLAEGSAELLDNYKTVNSSLREVEKGLSQIESGIMQLEMGILMMELQQVTSEAGLAQMDTMLSVLDSALKAAQTALDYANQQETPDLETIAELEARILQLEETKVTYLAKRQEYADTLATCQEQLPQLKEQKTQLEAQKTELETAKQTLDEAMEAIELGMLEMQNGQTQADNQFISAEAQLEAGQVQLESAQSQLELKMQELQEGKITLEEAEAELAAGWESYEDGKAEAEKELADAKKQLDDAKLQLDDAKELLDDMTETSVFVLSRNSNVGYQALDSNSDIVAGVSKVFPAFFLAVAALVCITTMTRMVSEERTQIGTLKALGYSNFAIISKYLVYAGSGAVFGSGIGVILGSVVFPIILWEAYGIILNITPEIILLVNWPLCIAVVGMYVGAMLLVTWYCCRLELREVPAELIRPKSPSSGKKIFLEHFKFWDRFSFLNKVMLRNVFRYRQRMLMMLLGIGGCTALLITGFGLRDSIAGVADHQFEEVTQYDIQVYFSENQTEESREAFRLELRGQADQTCFLHQSNVKILFDGNTRDVTLMSGDADLADFIDFHDGKRSISMPGDGEAIISIGIADLLNIRVGDVIQVQDLDMNLLNLIITDIFDNNVSNYVVVSPETIQNQWGSGPDYQVGFVTMLDNKDVHETAAEIAGMDDVINLTVSADMAESVASMMNALDLVVITVVVCAGLLAAIVLYNLININIKERIREIATIKVLGFNARETAAYVFKENLLLSGLGSLCGVLGGKFLLDFVMSEIRVDFVWLQAVMTWKSCLISLFMTMLAACLVDFIFYFKLDKINMAEALKSVE